MMNSEKQKILFFCESVTLAHIIRPLSLIRLLDPNKYEIAVASAAHTQKLFQEFQNRFHVITCQTSDSFKQALAKGTSFVDENLLRQQVKEDLALIDKLQPDIVVGDFRLSLNISARKAKKPYLNLTNLHWATFTSKQLPTPDIPPMRLLGYPLANFIFQNFISHLLPFILKSHAKGFNKICQEYTVPTYEKITDAYIDGDLVGLCDISQPHVRLNSNYVFLGPICGDSSAQLPAWFAELTSEKNTQQPKLYFNLGSSGDHSILDKILTEIESLNFQTIVGAPPDQIQALQSKYPAIHWSSNLPGSKICQWADIIIFNGGSPSAHQALLEGKPVIGITTNPDQVLNMNLLENFSFVRNYRNWNLKPTELKQALIDMTQDPEIKKAAQQYAEKLRAFDSKQALEQAIKNCMG